MEAYPHASSMSTHLVGAPCVLQHTAVLKHSVGAKAPSASKQASLHKVINLLQCCSPACLP
eukprot:10078553-Karenia_brevis.AAC.1